MSVAHASPSLQRVVKGNLCAGCGLCASVARQGKISMTVSEEGFLRPRQHEALTLAEEATIEAACPGMGLSQDAAGREDHPLWGPHLSLARGWAGDEKLRHRASSGGALSALLDGLLSSGVVAKIVQTGADPARPWANIECVSRTKTEIAAAAGSRYAPSAPLASIETHLSAGEPFVFVGKPCDVAALRALGRRDERVGKTVALMVSFFCAGTPSLKGAEALLEKMGAAPSSVAEFRYRGDGWPGAAAAMLASGERRTLSYEESWGAVLSKHLQTRCKICPDGVGGAADIVFADAWECDEAGYPQFDERAGVSLILTRSGEGAEALKAVVAAGGIITEPETIDVVASMQPGQLRRKRLAWSRLAAFAALWRPRPRFRGYQLSTAARSAGPLSNIRSFLGTCRRLAFGLD